MLHTCLLQYTMSNCHIEFVRDKFDAPVDSCGETKTYDDGLRRGVSDFEYNQRKEAIVHRDEDAMSI